MKVLVCPSCHSIMICPTHLVGTLTLCPNCQTEVQVPNGAESDVDELKRLKKELEETPGKKPVDETQPDAGAEQGRDTDP